MTKLSFQGFFFQYYNKKWQAANISTEAADSGFLELQIYHQIEMYYQMGWAIFSSSFHSYFLELF